MNYYNPLDEEDGDSARSQVPTGAPPTSRAPLGSPAGSLGVIRKQNPIGAMSKRPQTPAGVGSLRSSIPADQGGARNDIPTGAAR